jgi:hypothetical protein
MNQVELDELMEKVHAYCKSNNQSLDEVFDEMVQECRDAEDSDYETESDISSEEESDLEDEDIIIATSKNGFSKLV